MKTYEAYKDSGIEWIGEIPVHWELKKLKYSFYLIMGQSPNSIDCNSNGNGIPFLQGNADFNSKHPHPVSWCKKPAKIAPKGSVLISVRAPIGAVNVADQEYCIGRGLCALCSKIPSFLYYHAICLNQELNSLGTGSTFKAVSAEQVSNTFTIIPPLPEQTAIASYLDRKTAEIDQLITDKKRLLELYEEEKTAIINQAVTKGLNPDAPMKDSGIEWLGEIPEHWEVKKIGYCARVVRGSSPRPTGDPRYFMGNYMHWITVKEVTNAKGKYIVDTEEFLTEAGSKLSRIVEPDTLLLSNSGATLGVPKITKIKGCINDGSVAFPVLKSFLDKDYLFYFFVSHTNIYREQMKGNGQPNLNTEIIKSTITAFPSTKVEQQSIVYHIETECARINTQIERTNRLIELLTEYRTALINEVVTGKIKVTE